jgi:hypothetical protein
MEKRSKKNMNTNLINIKSNKTLKNQKSSKKSNHLSQASYNFIKNNSHNQINNYKFSNTINAGKMSKKNTYAKKGKKVKNRNKNLPSDLDKDMNKFKSYNSESNKNKLFNGTKSEVKKNSELEYISKHENRFHCPKQLFTLNKKKEKSHLQKLKN